MPVRAQRRHLAPLRGDCGGAVRCVDLANAAPVRIDSPFAYPYAQLAGDDGTATAVNPGIDPAKLRKYWQLGLAMRLDPR